MSDDLKRGGTAGMLAAAAYLVGMALDIALTKQRTNDLRLLAGLVPGGRRGWPVVGTSMHLINGTALGAVYARVHHGLPGPAWMRGVIFGLVENFLLWPVMVVLDRVHPGIRSGELDRYNRPGPFLAEIFRHVVYGAALGFVYDQLVRRS